MKAQSKQGEVRLLKRFTEETIESPPEFEDLKTSSSSSSSLPVHQDVKKGVDQGKGHRRLADGTQADGDPAEEGDAGVVVEMQQRDLLLPLAQHEEDRVEEVDKLGDHVEVVEKNRTARHIGKRGKVSVENVRPGGRPVGDEGGEDGGVVDGQRAVVHQQQRPKVVRLSPPHPPRAQDEDEEEVGDEEKEGHAKGGHEGEVTHARIAMLVPEAHH
mgnify:CR=1 FL=1